MRASGIVMFHPRVGPQPQLAEVLRHHGYFTLYGDPADLTIRHAADKELEEVKEELIAWVSQFTPAERAALGSDASHLTSPTDVLALRAESYRLQAMAAEVEVGTVLKTITGVIEIPPTCRTEGEFQEAVDRGVHELRVRLGAEWLKSLQPAEVAP